MVTLLGARSIARGNRCNSASRTRSSFVSIIGLGRRGAINILTRKVSNFADRMLTSSVGVFVLGRHA
jgi:hypothetical protein